MQFIRRWYHQGINKAREVYNQAKQIFGVLHQAATSETAAQLTQYIGSQIIEGFKAVATFPFTLLKMPFNRESRRLLFEVIKYNGVYYLMPALAYHGLVRESLQHLINPLVGDYIWVVDIAFNVAMFRSATNAYFFNVFNNTNAASICINQVTTPLEAPCLDQQCAEAEHIRGTLMSPLYYLGKTMSSSLLSLVPYFGWLFRYFIKPLGVGEGLVEGKLGDYCNHHRQKYFSRHVISSYGIGIAALISVEISYAMLGHYTGVYSLWAYDAIYNMLFPFMVFHIHNHAVHEQFQPGIAVDIFYPVRASINKAIELGAHEIVPRIMRADDNGRLLKYLANIWSSAPLTLTRRLLIYRSSTKSLYHFVQTGPVRQTLQINAAAAEETLDTLNRALANEGAIKIFLNLYAWVPFVPPKDHLQFIMAVLTKDKSKTQTLLIELSHLLQHAQHPKHVSKKIYVSFEDIDIQASYYGGHPPLPLTEDDFQLIDEPESSSTSATTLRQRRPPPLMFSEPVLNSQTCVQRSPERAQSPERPRYPQFNRDDHGNRAILFDDITIIDNYSPKYGT